jgi:hypothetical protein
MEKFPSLQKKHKTLSHNMEELKRLVEAEKAFADN